MQVRGGAGVAHVVLPLAIDGCCCTPRALYSAVGADPCTMLLLLLASMPSSRAVPGHLSTPALTLMLPCIHPARRRAHWTATRMRPPSPMSC